MWRCVLRSFSLTPAQYTAKVNQLLEALVEQLEAHEGTGLEDVSLSDGVLTLTGVGGKTFVLNKQTPNLQVWLSSPFSYFPLSGPKRYEFVSGHWRNVKDGHDLLHLLSTELATLHKSPVTLRYPAD